MYHERHVGRIRNVSSGRSNPNWNKLHLVMTTDKTTFSSISECSVRFRFFNSGTQASAKKHASIASAVGGGNVSQPTRHRKRQIPSHKIHCHRRAIIKPSFVFPQGWLPSIIKYLHLLISYYRVFNSSPIQQNHTNNKHLH